METHTHTHTQSLPRLPLLTGICESPTPSRKTTMTSGQDAFSWWYLRSVDAIHEWQVRVEAGSFCFLSQKKKKLFVPCQRLGEGRLEGVGQFLADARLERVQVRHETDWPTVRESSSNLLAGAGVPFAEGAVHAGHKTVHGLALAVQKQKIGRERERQLLHQKNNSF